MSIFSNATYHRKCIEPVKRRRGTSEPQWQPHRFEIKGGISFRDAMVYDMMSQPNRVVIEDDDGNLSFRGMPVRIVEAA